jgi:hypothetical protein
MRRTSYIVALALTGLVIFRSVEVQGQATRAEREATAAVTIAELNGVVIEAAVVHQQVLLRQGEKFPNRSEFFEKYVIKGDKIEGTINPTNHNHWGTRKGKTQTAAATLERPTDSKNFGGGNGVWIFDQGTITNLYVFKGGGAFRREIFLSRTDNGLSCTIKQSFARENGVGSIVWNSSVDGSVLTLVSNKVISSSCKISKRN